MKRRIQLNSLHLLLVVSCLPILGHASGWTEVASLSARAGRDKVIVHLFEWSWRDIAKECPDLARWGYWGVQVSPPQEDMLGNKWWSRYQPYSYNILSRSGGLEDFKHMIAACRQHGVHIIVDAVLNHMANPSAPNTTGRGGSVAVTKCQYPGTYSCQDFHHFCGPSATDACSCCNCEVCGCGCGGSDNIWHCNLGGLPDLDTSREHVRARLAAYLNRLLQLGVYGVRIDAAKHIDPDHLRDVLARVRAPGLYVNQEIRLDGEDCNCINYERDYKSVGKIWEFKSHSVFYDALMHKNLPALSQLASGTQWGPCTFANTNDAISFVVNHDFLASAPDRTHTITMFDEGLYSLSLILLLAHPYGQPTLLSSINFDPSMNDVTAPVQPDGSLNATLRPVYDPKTGQKTGCGYWKHFNPDQPYLCEHAWPEVRNMVKFRQVARLLSSTPVMEYFNDGKAMSLSYVGRAGVASAFLLVNVDDQPWQGWVDTKGMEGGVYCNVAGSGAAEGCSPCTDVCVWKVTVQPGGWADIGLGGLQAVAIHNEAGVPLEGVEKGKGEDGTFWSPF